MNPYDIAPVLKRILGAMPGIGEIVFAPEHAPKVVQAGVLKDAPLKDMKRFSAYQTEVLAGSLLADNARARREFLREGATALSFTVAKTNHFRVHLIRQLDGISCTMKVIPFHPPTLEYLGLPKEVAGLLEKRRGLVLVTSPTRGGKSTTLAAMLHHINQTSRRQIMTVEAPVEFRLGQGRGLVQHLETDGRADALLTGMQKALRQGCRVLMCADLDHPDLLTAAVDAAAAGHLVLGAMSTSSAQGTMECMRSYLPEGRARARFARYMTAVLSQDLMPRKDAGRVAAFEILIGNDACARWVEQNGSADQLKEIIRTHHRLGMRNFADDLQRLVDAGLVPADKAENLQVRATGEFKAAPRPPKESGNRILELDDSYALEVME